MATLFQFIELALTKFEYSYYTWIYGISSVNLNSICKFVHKPVKVLDDACPNLLEKETAVASPIENYYLRGETN